MVFSTLLNYKRPQWLTQLFTEQRSKMFLVAAGVGLGLGAMHFTFVRPLIGQISALRSEVSSLQTQVSGFTGTQDGVTRTNDLLQGLAVQRQTFDAARGSLDRIRGFREEVDQEARRTSDSLAALRGLKQVQVELVDAAAKTATANASIEKIVAFQDRVSEIGTAAHEQQVGVDEADAVLTSLAQLKQRVLDQQGEIELAQEQLTAFHDLRQSLVAAADELELAIASADGMRELTASIADGGTQVAKAKENAVGLLTLHDSLADAKGIRLPEARRNLVDLFQIRAELNENTAQVAAAAENLELLIEFQNELTARLGEIKGVRRDLVEITMLKETVDRVSEAVRPLAEMTDFKRLDEADMRAYARRILERRTAQSSDRIEFVTPPSGLVSPVVKVPVNPFTPPATSVSSPVKELPVPEPADAAIE